MPMPTPRTSAVARRSEERRGWVRHACALAGECQPITQLESGNRWPVRFLDMSRGGVGVLLSRRFEINTLITFELEANATTTVSLPLAHVRSVRRYGNYWLLGCVWAHVLPEEELQPLVNHAAAHEAMWEKVRKALKVAAAVVRRPNRSPRDTPLPGSLPLLGPHFRSV